MKLVKQCLKIVHAYVSLTGANIPPLKDRLARLAFLEVCGGRRREEEKGGDEGGRRDEGEEDRGGWGRTEIFASRISLRDFLNFKKKSKKKKPQFLNFPFCKFQKNPKKKLNFLNFPFLGANPHRPIYGQPLLQNSTFGDRNVGKDVGRGRNNFSHRVGRTDEVFAL
jgi:hypothetical protein